MLASLTTKRFGNSLLPFMITSDVVLLAIGMTGLLFVIHATGQALNLFPLIAPLLICGVGMGPAVISLLNLTMSSVRAPDAGAGSGASQTFQHMEAALGIAIAG